MSKIFIVEDDPSIRAELTELLQNSGYETDCVTDFSRTAETILASDPDLILLDINIPYINGEEVLRTIRQKTDTPVIMVTSRTSETDEVLSMSFGADDYITKPYNPTILLLRISAILKRSVKNVQTQTYRGLEVNDAKGSLIGNDKECVLTKNEMIIFRLMLDNMGQIVTRDDLMTCTLGQ